MNHGTLSTGLLHARPAPPRTSLPDSTSAWTIGPLPWALLLAAVGLLAWIGREGLEGMIGAWDREEYSHALMLPLLTVFFMWQKSTDVAITPFRHSPLGVVLVVFGLLLHLVGELGTVTTLIQYAFLITLAGTLLSFMGWQAFKIIAPAYFLLFFTVPLPSFLYNNLSAQLQLISSELGVTFIRLFGISVFLEGNVIDLGAYKLQVAEACSGLRYLFPLMALGYISAYVFSGALWKKATLLLATIPIAVLMNSLRIGIIGVLVEYGGIAQAEGFLHDFEGWVVFMACTVLLVLLMALLAKTGKEKIPLRDAFAIAGPRHLPDGTIRENRNVPPSFFVALSLLALVAASSAALPYREDRAPERTDLLFFPSRLGEWQGRVSYLDHVYVDALKVHDYLLSDYSTRNGESVNLYIAYYEAQRRGASVHSPKSCLPGGGWQIKELSQQDVAGVAINDRTLRANRAVIQIGDERHLVYYWFQQRGRTLTNEYLVKWYLFWDALTRHRTDGALVRLTTPLTPGEDPQEGDSRLSAFARAVEPQLNRFVPN